MSSYDRARSNETKAAAENRAPAIPIESGTTRFDHVNTLIHHEAREDSIDLLINVPLIDGSVAEAKVVLGAPIKSLGPTGRPEYSMKVDTNLSVTPTQRKSSGRTELQSRDGLWWEIPIGYPGASTVLLFHEPKVREFLTSRFTTGGTFVDIGANVGAYTLRAISRGMTVHPFEPNPENVRLLKRNAELNDLHLEVYEVALGAADGSANISQNGATSRITDEIVGIKVPIRTLDSFHLPKVDLLKIDVEGYELEVLRGARETLNRTHPAILLEMHHWIGAESEARIFDILLDSSYRFEYLDTYNQGRHLVAQVKR